jgi:aldose 1-epimerase
MREPTKTLWGRLESGDEVYLYRFENAADTAVAITNFGGRIVSIEVPGRSGERKDIVLGFDELSPYQRKNPYFGALVGRYANRIANAEFRLDGHVYSLPRNNGRNSLHGGLRGFDSVVWQSRTTVADGVPALELSYVSRDGEEGYPGELRAKVLYTLTDTNELRIDFAATTDKKTIVNLTNHSYFNLSGADSGDVLNQVVTINADAFTPVDEHLIPTGKVERVATTPFDFTTGKRIGDRIDFDNEQLRLGKGYDHNFVLNRAGHGLALAARAVDPGSGRVLEVLTTEPGMQFYTGNHLDGSLKGKDGATYGFRSGFCFETQHFPDSPNHSNFPSTELNPGQEFRSSTAFRFSVE